MIYESIHDAPRGRYAVAEVDPPWAYRARGTRACPAYAGPQRPRAGARYETMSVEEVAALPVGEILAPSAIVALWITNSMLLEAAHLPVLAAWGLAAKQIVPWVKTTRAGALRIGMGNYTRVVSEHVIYAAREGDLEGAERCLVLATRGRATTLVGDRSVAGVLVGPPRAGVHSAKPDAVRDLLDQLAPDGSRVEVFSRAERPGWDAVGDQVAGRRGGGVTTTGRRGGTPAGVSP